jgi:hypothetical protein
MLTSGVNHRFEVGTERRAVRSFRRAQRSRPTVPTSLRRRCWASCNTLTNAALDACLLAVRNVQIERQKHRRLAV